VSQFKYVSTTSGVMRDGLLSRSVVDAAPVRTRPSLVPVQPAGAVPAPTVAILLCTYYGEQFLADQLESFAVQTHRNWQAYASDDASQDATAAILMRYQEKWGVERFSLRQGPGQGFAANFLSLTCDQSIKADYYAYSDQDDIWEADKLQRALAWLEGISPEIPALYCSRALLVNEENQPIGNSPLFKRPPSFSNSLVQSIGGGNTMVFNDALRKLLMAAGSDVQIISHDCWAYMVAAGCGGKVFHDNYPSLRYRQHEHNIVGTNRSWRARYTRFQRLYNGWLRSWNDHNIASLRRLQDRLTPENRRILDDFSTARDAGLILRLRLMKRTGIYRQSWLGDVAFFLAAILNKI